MGGHSLSLAELETLLTDQGVISTKDAGKRIASDENTKFLYIKDVKKAIEEARVEQEKKALEIIEGQDKENKSEMYVELSKKSFKKKFEEKVKEDIEKIKEKDSNIEGNDNEKESERMKSEYEEKSIDSEFEKDLALAIQLSLQDIPSTSKETTNKGRINFSYLENFKDEDFLTDSEEEEVKTTKDVLSSARNYMIEYSGLTPAEVENILERNSAKGKSIAGKNNMSRFININSAKKATDYIQNIKIENQINNNKIEKNSLYAEQEVDSENIIKESNKYERVKNTKENKEIEAKLEKNCLVPVEIMSSSSETDEEFLEVSSLSEVKTESKLEVVVNPTEELEDDIFADIFENTDIKVSLANFNETKNVLNANSESASKIELNKNTENTIINREKIKINQDDGKLDVEVKTKSHEKVNIKGQKEKQHEILNQEKEKLEIQNREITQSTEKISQVFEKSNQKKFENSQKEVNKNKAKEAIKELLPIIEEQPETSKTNLSTEELQKIQSKLEEEGRQLIVEKANKERVATNLSEQMYYDAQDLLELFGIPYIVAPMEAEAQCAFLEQINLTNGTITDDSDIWLFGGKTVYKNFFDQSKRVMEFQSENIQHHFSMFTFFVHY